MEHDLIHLTYNVVKEIVLWSSLLSILLPPIEFFNDYPKFQKGYTLLIKIVNRYGALNIRGPVVEFLNQKRNGEKEK
jgi:hypothetical protein